MLTEKEKIEHRRASVRKRKNLNLIKWRSTHKEQHQASDLIWRVSNHEKILLQQRHWRLTHQKECRAATRKWRKAHPERFRTYVERRRAYKINAPGWKYTTTQHILWRWEMWGNKCYICNNKAVATDHVISLSKGKIGRAHV